MVKDSVQPVLVPLEAGNTKAMFKLTYDLQDHRIFGGKVLFDIDSAQDINVIFTSSAKSLAFENLAYADFFFQPGFNRTWNIINIAAKTALGKSAIDTAPETEVTKRVNA